VLGVSDAGIVVACGDAALRLTELQRPGGKRLPAAAFLQGRPLVVNRVFASAPH
jgi:methionyl-tRNA formyltransferase